MIAIVGAIALNHNIYRSIEIATVVVVECAVLKTLVILVTVKVFIFGSRADAEPAQVYLEAIVDSFLVWDRTAGSRLIRR